ncbi:hypothetical protein [Nitrospira sp. Ecomares 2.1]
MVRQGIEEAAASLLVFPNEFREIVISAIPINRMAEDENIAALS